MFNNLHNIIYINKTIAINLGVLLKKILFTYNVCYFVSSETEWEFYDLKKNSKLHNNNILKR